MPDDKSAPRDPYGRDTFTEAVGEAGAELGFEEDTYLRAYPDVAEAVERGDLRSGLEHYLHAGRAEQRLQRPEYGRQMAADRAAMPVPVAPSPRSEIDAFILSDSGALFLSGWSDDRHDPLVSVSIGAIRAPRRTWSRFARMRRNDVVSVLPSSTRYHYGFWLFGGAEDPRRPHGMVAGVECRIELRFTSGAIIDLRRAPSLSSDPDLRDHVMSHFASSEYWGNRVMEAFNGLDQGAGEQLATYGRSLSYAVATRATAERFGPQRKRFRGSIVVPLLGIADFLFLQACAYAAGPGIEDYEFIYVINSPELVERLRREARIAQAIYGLAQTLVYLPGNAGCGPANDVAVQYAQSDRLLFIHPDVFPKDADWAKRHTAMLSSLPTQQTRLFGTTLYYGDGSLMHGGLQFESDLGIHVDPAGIVQQALIRVEHIGRGAPAGATQFTTPRAVPAVSGAFISADRPWFEKLGGFSEDYMFGGDEDADLCLRSLQAGGPVWLHDLRMWHLEGKGSRHLPQHEGAALLNRWQFARKWQAMIVPDLLGPTPRHLLLHDDADARPHLEQRRSPEPAMPLGKRSAARSRAR
ncbi:MAG TPA: hypothetical protein VGG99_14165 [Acetobacteraceae bacterium]|jgi:GT2 family glycosyltransferase